MKKRVKPSTTKGSIIVVSSCNNRPTLVPTGIKYFSITVTLTSDGQF